MSEGSYCSEIEAIIPNYCEDLNLMHEAEQKLGDLLPIYYSHFVDLDGVTINASAQERANAFVKTIT